MVSPVVSFTCLVLPSLQSILLPVADYLRVHPNDVPMGCLFWSSVCAIPSHLPSSIRCFYHPLLHHLPHLPSTICPLSSQLIDMCSPRMCCPLQQWVTIWRLHGNHPLPHSSYNTPLLFLSPLLSFPLLLLLLSLLSGRHRVFTASSSLAQCIITICLSFYSLSLNVYGICLPFFFSSFYPLLFVSLFLFVHSPYTPCVSYVLSVTTIVYSHSRVGHCPSDGWTFWWRKGGRRRISANTSERDSEKVGVRVNRMNHTHIPYLQIRTMAASEERLQ